MANYYDSSNLWKDNPGDMSDFQTLDSVLGFGQHMNEAANPIANQTVQDTIIGAKNNLESYKQSLMNIQQAETYEDLLNMRNDFQALDLGLTPDLGNKHNAGLNILQGAMSGAQTGSIGGPWGMLGGAITGAIGTAAAEIGGQKGAMGALGTIFFADPLIGSIIGSAFDDKTDEKQKVYQELKDKENEYNTYAQNFFNMNAQNINNKNYRNMLANVTAFGGYLQGNGGDWSDGLTFINNGGKHGQNPYGGVPMGIAPDGKPNLAEEGEIIWNDYVFSDRIKVPKTLSEKYKLKDNVTFAKAVEKIQKGAEERPNDKIEQDTLNNILSEFMTEQEIIRQKKAEKQAAKELQGLAEMFADGGNIHIAKNKRGTFTAAAKKRGMGVQEFARKVLANKEDYSPAMVKKANFARNASKWKHAFGGPMGHYFSGKGPYSNYLNYKPYFQEDILKKQLFPEDFWRFKYKQNPTLGTFNTNPKSLTSSDGLTYNFNPDTITLGIDNTWQPPTELSVSPTIRNRWTNATGTMSGSNYSPVVSDGDNGLKFNASYLRYAPILGSAISSIAAALDTPNRTYAKNLRNSARAFSNMMQPISSRPIANYLRYNPLDRMFYTNQYMANAAATRSAVRENANANRQAAINSLLAADYNANVGLGNLFRQAEEFNREQRERVTGFNRETDRYNSAIALDAAKQNAAIRQAKASMLWDAVQKANMLDMQEDQLLQASRNQTLTNLFNNLGGVGKESWIFKMIEDNPALMYAYLNGASGSMGYKGK